MARDGEGLKDGELLRETWRADVDEVPMQRLKVMVVHGEGWLDL